MALEILDNSKYGEFVRKLDEYQQATGINETTRDQIWSKTIQNSKLLENSTDPDSGVENFNLKFNR